MCFFSFCKSASAQQFQFCSNSLFIMLDSDKAVELVKSEEFSRASCFVEALALRNEVFMPEPMFVSWKKLLSNKLRSVELPTEREPTVQLEFYKCLRRCFSVLSDDMGMIACWNEELKLKPDPDGLVQFCRKCLQNGKKNLAVHRLKESLKTLQGKDAEKVSYCLYKLTRRPSKNRLQKG